MKAATLKTFHLTRGNTYKESLRFTDQGDPLDISTNYVNIEMDIRTGVINKSTKLYDVSLGNGITISGDDNDIINIYIDSSITKDWSGGQYYRDIKFIDNSNDKFTLCEGTIEIRENIT